MTGELFRAQTGAPIRKAGSGPPGYDRVAGAFRQSGRWLTAIGVAAAGASLAFLATGLSGVAGTAWPIFVYAAGFALVVALLPLVLGYRRLQRVAFLATLRARWSQLDRVGDPDDQVATLRRAYGGLIANDVVARAGAR
jgi:hypothetical protein